MKGKKLLTTLGVLGVCACAPMVLSGCDVNGLSPEQVESMMTTVEQGQYFMQGVIDQLDAQNENKQNEIDELKRQNDIKEQEIDLLKQQIKNENYERELNDVWNKILIANHKLMSNQLSCNKIMVIETLQEGHVYRSTIGKYNNRYFRHNKDDFGLDVFYITTEDGLVEYDNKYSKEIEDVETGLDGLLLRNLVDIIEMIGEKENILDFSYDAEGNLVVTILNQIYEEEMEGDEVISNTKEDRLINLKINKSLEIVEMNVAVNVIYSSESYDDCYSINVVERFNYLEEIPEDIIELINAVDSLLEE